MAYATQTDIQARYGEDALYAVADRDGDGGLDTEAIGRALDDATAEIDSYLAARYPLPLPVVPKIATILCVDIALYRLAPDNRTDERRQRYEDAVKLLRAISEGKANLGITEPEEVIERPEISIETRRQIFSPGDLDRY